MENALNLLLLLIAVPLAWSDARCRRLPNSGLALLAVAGLASGAAAGIDLVLERSVDMAVVLLVGYAVRWICLRLLPGQRLGGGDIKLLAAVASWGGLHLTVWTCIAGSAVAVLFAFLRPRRNSAPRSSHGSISDRLSESVVLGPWLLLAAYAMKLCA